LNIKKDSSLISNESFCRLVDLNKKKIKKKKILVKLFEYKYYDKFFILNMILLYKNKTAISNKQLKNLVYNHNNGLLKVNGKNINGDYPLLIAIKQNDIELVNLLLKYAKENNIILEINEKNKDGNYPLIITLERNNIKMFKLLMDYAKRK